MAQEAPPESVILGQFGGIKNVVSSERLGPSDLELAINVDIDDAGQLNRRRGYVKKNTSPHHSLRTIGGKTLVVRSGVLGLLRSDYSFAPILNVNDSHLSYAEVAGDIYFTGNETSGVIAAADNSVSSWGHTNGQGVWDSPVLHPSLTLGAVGGQLLGDPIRATTIEEYNGRIYMAAGPVLWATELYRYHYVDRTKNFMQFEDDITLVMAMTDGLYVGTKGSVNFLQGMMHNFKLTEISKDAVLPGSGQYVPAEMVHPNARNSPMPTSRAAVFMTAAGVLAGFDGGTTYNLTQDKVIFPDADRAASLFRQDAGSNAYVASIESQGAPSAGTRIGDYCDAEIIRLQPQN